VSGDADRDAFIDHTCRVSRFSRADIDAALAVVGDDPSVLALGQELVRATGRDLVVTLLLLSQAVDSFDLPLAGDDQ
jgi:hypothetical protein